VDLAESAERNNAARGKSLCGNAYVAWGTTQLKRLLEEAAAKQIRTLLDTEFNAITVGMPECIAVAQEKIERIHSLDASGIIMAFPPGWDQDAGLVTESTGMVFIDKFLGTGTARSEVYGLLGPYGSCKTTLACILAAEAAKSYQRQFKLGDKPRVAFIASYEAPLKELELRIVSYLADIPRRSLESARDYAKDLSHSSDLRDYEKDRWRHLLNQNISVPGEYERMQAAISWLNLHLCILDFSNGKNSVGGAGGADEIAQRIQGQLRAREAECGMVVVDYVGAAVERLMTAQNIPVTELRHYIGRFPLRVKHKVAAPLDCPVWLLHQLAAAANSRASGAIQHHTDAAEAKNFAENLDFCFQLGVPEKVGDATVLNLACTKHRRRPQEGHTVLEIRGDWNMVVDGSAKYHSEAGSKIVPVGFADAVAPAAAAPSNAAQAAAHISSEAPV
jgi:hypothetical protein